MFENMTYENILTSMLDKVPADISKIEGSIIYDALAPCAFELSQNYFMLNNFIDMVFTDTAVGKYLERKVADFGLNRKQPTKAVRGITTDKPVDIGTRWAIEDITYVIVELATTGYYKAECEQYGEKGNIYNGMLQSLDNISGVTAKLTDILASGQDIETDDNLRIRFYNKVQMPSTSGNTFHYKQWALEVEGVGGAKVFPLSSGPGTVKVVVVNSDKEIDNTLPAKVSAYIETVRPIGATVTVISPTAKQVNIVVEVTLNKSKTIEEVKALFEDKLKKYFCSTVFKTYSISYAMIGSLLLATDGVEDYTNLKVNSGTANITIADTEVPTMGTVTLS